MEPPQNELSSAVTESRLVGEDSVQAEQNSAVTFPYYKKVCSKKMVRAAWKVVWENGCTSKSEETRREIKEFGPNSERHLDRIIRQLKSHKFEFPPAKGILIKKKAGKKPRPLVKAPIISRIVQRTILDVLQSEPALEPYYRLPSSFGGIKGKGLGVAGAIASAYEFIRSGNGKFFVRSDIEGFFTKIPKDRVLSKIKIVFGDQKFQNLVEQAAKIELENLAELGSAASQFPLYEEGVAQGCCLSPLFGNILLEEFDKELNGRGIKCIRYIDDFLILGPSQRCVLDGFEKAQRILSEMGLSAYDPRTNHLKAEIGLTRRALNFLGCQLRLGMISPSKQAKDRLLISIKTTLHRSIQSMNPSGNVTDKVLNLVETLRDVNNVLTGWGHQYSFCNDRELFKQMDVSISIFIEGYLKEYRARNDLFKKSGRHEESRRILGVHLLRESKSAPIVVPLRMGKILPIDSLAT